MEFAHIKTIKLPEHKQQPDANQQSFLRKTSFTIETEASFDDLPPANILPITTLSGNLQRGTFAQRARAAELQAARARTELKSKDRAASPSPPPRRLLTLKMPRRQKWTPLDMTVPSAHDCPITLEISSNTDCPEQNSDTGDTTPKAQANTENELLSSNDQMSTNPTSDQRMDFLSSRLYGSRPTTALQSHDLDEYPAELGARIENSVMPLSNDSQRYQPTQQDSHEWTESSQYENSASQHLFMDDRNNFEQQQHHVNTDEQHQPSQSGMALNSADREDEDKEEPKSFAISQENQYQSVLGPHAFQDGDNTAWDTRNLTSNGASNSNRPKSYTAVRGTPAALNNNNVRLTPMNPAASPFYSSQNKGHGTRKPSNQEKEFFVRHLNSFVDEVAGQGPQHRDLATSNLSQLLDQRVKSQQMQYNSYPLSQSPHISGTLPQNDPFEEHAQLHRKRTGIWAPDVQYQANKPDLSEPQPIPKLTAAEKRAIQEKEVAEWWIRDNRVSVREKNLVEEAIVAERRGFKSNRNRFNIDDYDDYDDVVKEMSKDPASPYTKDEMVNDLLVPVIANLVSYTTKRPEANPFSKPPSWAIDHTLGGNSSFFSRQWGTPPQRVGRDPRYRAMQHDGRSSVFEDPTGRNPREEFSHGRARWTFQNDKFNLN